MFPKHANKLKKGDASAAEVAEARQLTGDLLPVTGSGDAVTFAPVTEEMKAFRGYAALRAARADAKLVGIRWKKSKEEKKEEKPKADE